MRGTYLKARGWYERHERRVSTFSLLFGFVFDSLTLRRVDTLRENAWVLTNILLVAILIVVVNRQEAKIIDTEQEVKQHFWTTNIMQFAFGAQLGTFLIFYFRSGTLTQSWPFLLILLGAMGANEYFKKHHSRLVFHASFLFLSIFLFSIFIVPVLTHRLGPGIFLLSGVVSLVLISLFLKLLKDVSAERFKKSRRALATAIGSIFVLMNVLYFTNIIPPIPLSLKDGGVYHAIARQGGGYVVKDEDRGLLRHFDLFPNVHVAPGAPLYAFSAVFAPTDLDTTIVHVWEKFDKKSVRWVEVSRVSLQVRGGSSGGWRTFSSHSGLTAGAWRVNVETPRGQVVGRLRFEVLPVASSPALVTKTIE